MNEKPVESACWDSEGGAVTGLTAADSLASGAASAGTFPEAGWYAVHTRARREKKIDGIFQKRQLQTFLPLLREDHRWSDRHKLVELPLFPGYVFVHMIPTPQTRLQVLQTNGVIGFAGASREGSPVRMSEIEGLRTLVARGIAFSLHPFLQAGRRVRIRGGALDGVEGAIVSGGDGKRLVISVELIQRSVSVVCEGYDVEPI
jgi:transcription antitermination factor NusG